MENLAIQSGAHSRFNMDPQIPREKFVLLYRTWIRKSLAHEMADEVFVIRDSDHAAGMVTVKHNQNRGDIGLIAVDSMYRGRGYGTLLVRASQIYFINRGCHTTQVVTQKENLQACRLYESCDYTIDRVEYLYHIWI